MTLNHPSHPGEAVWYDCIEPLGLTVRTAADRLGVSPAALFDLIDGRASVSAAMASRFEQAGWGTATGWLAVQAAYDRVAMHQGN